MNHYQPMQKAHTHHATTGNYSRYQTGKLVGEYRDIPAVIIDEAGFDGLGVQTQVGGADDAWCLVNVFDHLHRYVDSVAINGAIDADHAVCVALGQFDHLETAYGKIVSAEDASFDQMHWSSTAIYRVLSDDRQNAHYLPIINHKQLYDAATRITGLSVQWDGINPVSHGGISQLLLDMQKHDTYHEMVQRFDLTQALSDAQPMELDVFDALVESHNRLDLFKERLFRAMAKTPQDDIRAVNVTLTKPFKRQGVANIAMVFELSDGQHISIWFHNPDANPNKLGATDIMASWKWLLNRRDVTAALSPPNGANVQLPMLAHRMMRLAAKNSKRFIAAQKRKQANQAKLAAAQSLVDERLAKLSEQDEEIERLSQQLASLTPTQAPQTTTKAVMVDVDAEVVGAASDDPDERLHAKPEQAVIHNPQQMAQKAVQDEPTDEPVVLTGDEFGEFDISTNAGKKAYIEKVSNYLDTLNQKHVYNASLQADIVIGRNAVDKSLYYNGLNKSPVKMQAMAKILEILKQAKVFKPSKESYDDAEKRNKMTYHYLKTPFFVDGTEYGARIVVRQDKGNDKYYYDFQVRDNINVIFDGMQKNSPEEFPLTHSGLVQGYESHVSANDAKSQDVFDKLNDLASNMVLNLFIFDEHGNEITDDEPVGEAYSSDNPHAKYANDDALIKQNADNWENRLPRLTGDKVAEYNAKANPLGYVGDNEPRHASVGLYNLEKWVDVGDRRYTVKIDGKFKNFTSDESWDKPTDFEVYAEIVENGESNAWRNADDEQYYKTTNDFDEALAQAEHWLEMAKQLELNQDEPTDEPVVLTGKELGEFDLTTDGGQQQLLNKVVEKLQELKGAYVFNKSLNANVKLNSRGLDKIRKYNGLDKSPVKLQAVAKLTDIIANAKLFKTDDSYDTGGKKGGLVYYYLKTPFVVDGNEYGARIVIRGDGNGKFYYDLQVKDGVSVIFDSMEVKNPLGQGHSIRLEATSNGFDDYSTQTNAESQDDDAMLDSLKSGFDGLDMKNAEWVSANKSDLIQHWLNGSIDFKPCQDAVLDDLDDNEMLDSLKSGYVLNLFIFDEHGNEITDDEPTQNSQADAPADDKKVIAAQNKSRNSSIYDEVAKLIQMVDDENSNKNRYTAQIKDVVIINDIMGREHDFSKFELLKNVTVGFVRALNAIMQIADSKGYHLIISDYNSTLNQDNLFDNIFGAGNALTFGVIAQLGKDGVVCRISIDDIGRITVLQGSNGDKAMFMLKYNAPNLADKLADGFAMGHSDHPVDAPADDKKVIAAAELSQTKHDDANKQAKLPVQVIDVSAIDTDLSKYTGTSDEQAKAFFDEQLKGKVVKTQIGDVHLIGSTWKKIKQGLPKDKIKAKLVPFVPMILTQGKYEGKNALKKHPANQSYVAFHSFVKDGIKIDDSLVEARVFVGERDDGVYEFVVYSLHHDKSNAKNKALDSLTVVNATGLSKACNDSVLDDADDVNSIPQDGTVFDGVMFDDIEDGTDGWNIEIISITPIQKAVMNPNYTQDDIDYLNSIVNGSTNPLEVDFDRLIAIGEKDDTDPLFEQANDVISQALDQVTQGE